MAERSFDTFFRSAPPEVDVEHMRAAWAALRSPYLPSERRLPLPLWARRPYTEDGRAAWEILRHELATECQERPLCIYIHVPFCDSRCRFCDCYAFRLGAHRPAHIAAYTDQLIAEMQLWSSQGTLRQRPVSTVHLGGGTPTFLGANDLSRLLRACARLFGVTEATEWAIESTAAALTPEMLGCLHDIGVRRLHIGVQTLEEPVRQMIGRRLPTAEVLRRTAAALDLGWVVSVDLICGLPGQTLTGLIGTIRALAAIGVQGFSLYELLVYFQNRRWAESCGVADSDHVQNYWLFTAGVGYLKRMGYETNLFNHFALPADHNRYFTYPIRGEDLLALGTIADGVFGDYHYRHPIYKQYRRQTSINAPTLEGGLRESIRDRMLAPGVTALLAGRAPLDSRSALMRHWRSLGLIEPLGDRMALTASGSWFAGNMVEALIADDAEG